MEDTLRATGLEDQTRGAVEPGLRTLRAARSRRRSAAFAAS
ncbi:MAG: hypothetical protein MZW92_50245 [Comamonadaceae bacterium]|nr:hypothetical protein [Comamonadaceae bacterium]